MNALRLTSALLAAGSLLAFPGLATAQDWPAPGKPIQLIVPAPGGQGTGDTIARVIAEHLGKRLNTSIVIDNKAGANGNIGAAAAAAAPPDGYRLLFSWAGTLAVNPAMYRGLSFDPQKSFVPVGLIADVPNILVVNKDLPARDLKEFVAYAKANPGKLNYASTGSGSSMHLAGELFMRETGAQMVHVPYNAPGLATTHMISNEIQAMFQLVPGIIGQVKAGVVRPLAVLSPTRSPALPDVPTTTELGFGELQSSTWFALLAPAGTPPAIVERLNTELNAVLRDPEVKARLAGLGAGTLGGSSRQLAEHLARETVKWERVVRDARIQVQ